MFELHHSRHSQLSAKQKVNLLDETLHKVGLALEIKTRLPHTLSGGQAQRVMIAMMSILKPKILICDEPTTALDANIQKQILNLLSSFTDTLRPKPLTQSFCLIHCDFLESKPPRSQKNC